LTILEEGLISVPHRADSETDKGVLIDGTLQVRGQWRPFGPSTGPGGRFFLPVGPFRMVYVAMVIYQEEDLK
jgi:hypothetical protein